MRNVLIVDDEVEIIELIELYLEKDGYRIYKAEDGIEAWRILTSEKIDLALLDIMIPGIDGYQLVKKIRERYNIPVIFISAKSDANDLILGLGLGADDYIIKPFNPLELSARVGAHIRRFTELKGEESEFIDDLKDGKIILGTLILDENQCMLLKDNREIIMTVTEYKIMRFLMKNPNKVFTKKQIFEQVWEDEYYGDDNTIMVHISNIRDKIEECPRSPKYLKTVRGLGYNFQWD